MDITFTFSVIFTGITIVFIVLLLLILVMVLLGKVTSGGANPANSVKAAPAPAAVQKPAAAPKPAAPVKPAVEDGIGEEVVAVISAAVAAMTGGTGRPAVIRRADSKPSRKGRSPWSMAGLSENTQPF